MKFLKVLLVITLISVTNGPVCHAGFKRLN